MDKESHQPQQFLGVTISSTFTDLKEHRAALIECVNSHGFKDVSMERDAAKLIDVLESSLQMVRKGAAYIGVISKKYGQIPEDPDRNPDNLSITELEFSEAERVKRPILLFIMGDDHLVRAADVETDPIKMEKLKEFTIRAKKMHSDSSVNRVYAVFESLEDFKVKIAVSIAELQKHFEHIPGPVEAEIRESDVKTDLIPKPPAFYAEPPYIGSHKFVGRQAQLDALDDWAKPADQNPILLFEAIGGNGKSMLTWEWTTKHATKTRADWAGIFWYSFYEKGAIMADFCRRALAYMTGKPFEDFKKKKTLELKDLLVHQLTARPWVLILDGLERVLVAYNRIDAAEVADEEMNTPTDKIVNRDPYLCINAEDDDLLKALAVVAPSKILISSRLLPRAFFNNSGQTIPGVLRILLPGLRPADAEAMFRACGIEGDSTEIQNYLASNCDCHPLVIGILAGIVNDYYPARGDFDKWIVAQDGGGQFNMADLNLTQKRNHILKYALTKLPEKSRQLLSTISLLSESIDYQTLCAFNPHIPAELEAVFEPDKPEDDSDWEYLLGNEKKERLEEYKKDIERWKKCQYDLEIWHNSVAFKNAPVELIKTIKDLEERGLLQYDANAKRYDLHPVVRGVAAGGLPDIEKERYGQQVVDFFSSRPHTAYEEAESIDDVLDGINVVRTLLKIGHYQEAFNAYDGDLSGALFFNLELDKISLALIKPFFPKGWGELPQGLDQTCRAGITLKAGIALRRVGEFTESLTAYGLAILWYLEARNFDNLSTCIRNVSIVLSMQQRYAAVKRIVELSFSLADVLGGDEMLFICRTLMFDVFSKIGQWLTAEKIWSQLDSRGRRWNRSLYRPGNSEAVYALFKFWQGELEIERINKVEQIAIAGKNRSVVREMRYLRGIWLIDKKEWKQAEYNLSEAVRMARAIEDTDAESETWLALTKLHLNQLPDPKSEAEKLSQAIKIAGRPLAELWLVIGDKEQAVKYALSAYKEAWADGEPYVYRYELDKSAELLTRLGVEIPVLPPYDPSKDIKFDWEDKVITLIEELRAEKEKKEREKK